LSVSGGRVNVRLAGTVVSRLDGSSRYVTVTRTDLGSYVGVAAILNNDVYTGYDTVPRAETLTDPETQGRLALSGGRARFSEGGQTNVVAYLDDVAASTNGIATALQALAAEDASLSSRIDAEAAQRAADDVFTSNRLDSVVAALQAQIGSVGTSWGGQLSILSTALGNLRTEVQALRETESSDIAAVNSAIAAVQAAYTNADAAIQADLATLHNGLSGLESRIPSIISQQAYGIASNIVAAAEGGIVSNAVAAADAHIAAARTDLTTTINSNFSTLSSRIATNTTQLATLQARYNDLIAALAAASGASGSLTNNYHITLPAQIH
jgi:hypothetical protein